MRKLNRRDLLAIIKEEYLNVLKELDFSPYKGQDGFSDTLTVGLKVRHKKSGLLYTIASLGMVDILLRTADGKHFAVTKDSLEKDYDLD